MNATATSAESARNARTSTQQREAGLEDAPPL